MTWYFWRVPGLIGVFLSLKIPLFFGIFYLLSVRETIVYKLGFRLSVGQKQLCKSNSYNFFGG